MKEPKRIKLTDSPESKKINLIPLLPNNNYPDPMDDDIFMQPMSKNENNQQNNTQIVSKLESS